MNTIHTKNRILAVLIACLSLIAETLNAAGTWTPLAHRPPGAVGVMILLSDGTVMAENADAIDIYNAWYRLTPDAQGSYVNGTWTVLAPMKNTRLYFASAVLKDGRVFVAGGEYGSGLSNAETYNPVTNTWTSAPSQTHDFSDANSIILPDGKVMVARVEFATNLRGTSIFNPTNNSWSDGPSTIGIHNESVWLKLPDDSILMVDRDQRTSERYIPSLGQWVADATLPVSLYDVFGSESGAAVLLPNGKGLFLGATGHTAIYTPSGSPARGSWVAGPDIPDSKGTPDAPMAMMVNGKVLCAVSPLPSDADHFPSPTTFYEYDYLTNTFTAVASPTGSPLNHGSFLNTFLNLPDGTVLFSDFTDRIFNYQPDGTPLAAGKPTVTQIDQNVDGSYHLQGLQLNGISEGTSYGDENQNSSNYPIVRLTSGANVFYARTFNWSSTGVATGSTPQTTEFSVPAGVPQADYSLVVIANGISSDPVPFTHGPPKFTVSPTSDLVSVGAEGTGSYTPVSVSYTVKNSDTVSVDWSASKTQNWVTLSSSGGTLAPGTSVTVTVSINSAADALTVGNYRDTVTFTNVSKGKSTTRGVYLRIKHINAAPVANAQTVDTDEDTPVDIQLTGMDSDDDPLNFRVTVQPAHGTLSGPPPFLTYTPALNFHGADSFNFLVRDGQLQSTEATVSINVASVIDSLVANDDIIAPGVAANVLANDSDPDGTPPLTIESVTDGTDGTVSISVDKTTLTYTPGPGFFESDTFTYTVKNGANATATASVTVHIAEPDVHGIVSKNGAVSGEPAGTVFQLIGQPTITADGRTAFNATYRSPDNKTHSGIFFGETPALLVHDGSAAEGTTLNFSKFADPVVSSTGDVAFKASLFAAPKGTGDGIWAHDGNALRLVARQQNEAPGISGAFFSKFFDIALPDDGRVIFTASLAAGKGGVSSANDYTLWREDGAGSVALLLREGDPLEVDHLQKTIKSFVVFGPGSPGTLDHRRGFNNAGFMLVRVSFTDKSSALIRIKGDGSKDTIMRTGFRYAALGGKIASFNIPTFADDGSIAVLAKLEGPASQDSVIISRGEKGQLSILAREGALINNLGGAAYGSFSDPVGGDESRLAFISKLKPKLGGATSATDTVLWRVNPAGTLQLLARKGLPATGTNGAAYSGFKAVAWTGRGDNGVAFVATLKPKKGLVTPANDTGLWAEGSDGTLYLALREGATVQVGDATKTIKTFTMLGAVLGSIGQGHSSNFANGYAALATFTDNTKGVVTVWVP